jgi:hypothetical protein
LYPLLGDHICCTTFFQEAVSCTTLLHSLPFLPSHFYILFKALRLLPFQ